MKLVSVPLDGLPKFAGSITEAGQLIGVSAGDMAPVEFLMDMPAGRLLAVPGVDGAQGEPGPPGPAFDGTAWFYGQGEPVGIVGSKPGDMYMDVDTGTIYELGGN